MIDEDGNIFSAVQKSCLTQSLVNKLTLSTLYTFGQGLCRIQKTGGRHENRVTGKRV